MNAKQYHIVSVLAREASLSKAAGALEVSQPYLLQFIKKTEAEVGARLFERAGGNVRLTDAGKIYLEVGSQIEKLENQMASRFAELSSIQSGTITIGIAPFRSVGMLPRIAAAFQKKYPLLCLEAQERTRLELLEGAARGEFDLCITTLPVDERLFRFEPILEEEMVLAVPISFPPFEAVTMEGRRFPAVDVGIIDGKDFIAVREDQIMQWELENVCVEYNVQVRKAAVVMGLEAQLAMVCEGVGMALIPTGVLHDGAEKRVRVYSFRQPLMKRSVVAMWHKDKRLGPVHRDLIRTIREISW